ncbi:hypothetical protein AAC387_Pa05g0019 [Persea americana]
MWKRFYTREGQSIKRSWYLSSLQDTEKCLCLMIFVVDVAMPKNIQKKKTCRKRFVECVTGTLHIAQEDINNDRVAMVFGQDDCGRVRGLGLGVSRVERRCGLRLITRVLLG